MVIDTSAVLAVLQDEPERRAFNEAIEAAERRAMSTATFVESSIVVEDDFLRTDVAPVPLNRV